MAILPNVNLISNIGFSAGATHTVGNSITANMQTQVLDFPLKYPPFVVRDVYADAHTSKLFFIRTFFNQLLNKVKIVLRMKYMSTRGVK